MEILELVQKYINTDIQTVINEMYENHCAPQLIHDTVQLLKLKDTVDELKKNLDEWIRKYQVETDDPLTLSQVHNLLRLSPGSFDEELFKKIKDTEYFPEKLPLQYVFHQVPAKIVSNNTILYNAGDIKMEIDLSNEKIQELQHMLDLFPSIQNPTTYIMIGYPASGKSTVSKYMEEHKFGIHLSLDEWMDNFYPCSKRIGIHNTPIICFEKYVDIALSNGKNVIIDEFSVSKMHRANYIKKYHSYGNIVYIHMDIPIQECLSRNELRDDKAPQIVYDYIQNNYEQPSITEGADSIITNHYDETSKSYTVSVQCKESVDKGLVNNITTAINTLNMQQQILSYVHQYDGMEIQSVINKMYENHCSPQLIHDTVQLLKLKGTVDELKKNPDEWIRKHQVETDDPLSLKQLHGLFLLQDNYNDTLYDTLENSGYFPETLPLSYTVEIITCKRVQNNEIINNAGDIIIHTQLSSSLKNNIQHKITSFKTADDPMLILLSGYPASGKTTLAHILEDKEIGINFEMDEWITKSLNCTHVIGTRLIVKEYNRLIRESIDKGINVIINNVNSTVNTRRNNILTYKKNKTIILFQDVSKNICLIRNCNREKVLPDVVINQIIDEFELPSLATDNVDAIITNHYDEASKSYNVSIESRNEAFNEELKDIVETIEVVNGRNKIINTEDRINEIKTILNQSPQIPQKEI